MQRLRVNRGIEVNVQFLYHLIRLDHWCTLGGVSACVHPLVGLGGGGGGGGGTKHNESLINVTRHPQTKTKDYGTTTKIRTRTVITNASAAQVITGQGFWLWSRRVTISHRVNWRPLLSRRGSRRWPEPLKALKGWGIDLSWWSALGNPSPQDHSIRW